jgi:L-lactate permease
VATAATGLVTEERAIFRWTFFHRVGMCVVIAVLTPGEAYRRKMRYLPQEEENLCK